MNTAHPARGPSGSRAKPGHRRFPFPCGLRMLLAWMCLLSSAAAQTSGDFTYTVDGGAVTLTGYNGAGGAVTIPAAIAGHPVRTLGDSAFSYKSGVTGVVIPSSVTLIGNAVFNSCSGLTSISIPDSVTSIGVNVFAYCSKLTSITLPDSILTIGEAAFRSCIKLTGVSLPSGLTVLNDQVFYDCRSLTGITIPGSVASIGGSVFYGCTHLTGVIIPDRVTSIGNSAFGTCQNLTSVIIGNGVTFIEVSAFNSCTALAGIIIPDSVTTIADAAFTRCTGMTSVVIGTGTRFIGNWAFAHCTSLLSIGVAAGNTAYRSVEGVLFNHNQTTLIQYPSGKMGGYIIPDSVTTIGNDAFSRSAGLSRVTIPDSVTEIRYSAFEFCPGLLEIIIPGSVTIMDHAVFSRCSNLNRALFTGPAPASFGSSVFDNTAPGFTIQYYEGSPGFTSPVWMKYPATALPVTGESGSLEIQSFTLRDSVVTLRATGGKQHWIYELWSSPDLGITSWKRVDILTAPLAADGPVELSAPARPVTAEFYRIAGHLP